MDELPGLVLDPNGYFVRGGARFVPVGVNYWPASCGVELWQRWPEGERQYVGEAVDTGDLKFWPAAVAGDPAV